VRESRPGLCALHPKRPSPPLVPTCEEIVFALDLSARDGVDVSGTRFVKNTRHTRGQRPRKGARDYARPSVTAVWWPTDAALGRSWCEPIAHHLQPRIGSSTDRRRGRLRHYAIVKFSAREGRESTPFGGFHGQPWLFGQAQYRGLRRTHSRAHVARVGPCAAKEADATAEEPIYESAQERLALDSLSDTRTVRDVETT
jgi:hypothetical protein